MRIAVIAIGSRGDVQPYIALGQGLMKANHTVRLATHKDFEDLVKAHGLEFWLIRGNSQEMAESQETRDVLAKGNFIAKLRHIQITGLRLISEWLEDGLAASQGMDLLIAGSIGMIAGVPAAEKNHLSLVQAHVFPITPSRAFPNVMIPPTLSNLGGTFNLIGSYARSEKPKP